jgi:hypothetical protein
LNEPITLAFEGLTDGFVLKRIFDEIGLTAGTEYITYGKHSIDQKIARYNKAAKFSPWLVLRDLDEDAPCASSLISQLLPNPASKMRFQVAVRSLEAWLLADREAFSDFVSVPESRIPRDPDILQKPKLEFINLARQSRSAIIREAFVPAVGSTAKVGPGYTVKIAEFVAESWRPIVAAQRSPSLARLMRYLGNLSSSSRK